MPPQNAIMEMTLLPQNRVQARTIYAAQRRVPSQVISKARCTGFLHMTVASVRLCISVHGDYQDFRRLEDAMCRTGKPAM